ncbi:MAG TPA: MerR family transcriptional regulator [Longimicrobiaceae bacterium]|jgi:DNA-binding transcriptional MerR regulator|nr:MerR family transcriptional regulator [Longimicrobiaceae bacterium]
MKRRVPEREFWTIGEVCEQFGLKAHVLRYWETQFPALKPPKSRAGSRLYRARDLELIALIQRLVRDERYTLEGARQRIDELEHEGAAADLATQSLEHSFVRSLRGELEAILDLLGPEPQAG